jgi:hypothetical protein
MIHASRTWLISLLPTESRSVEGAATHSRAVKAIVRQIALQGEVEHQIKLG